MTGKAKLIPFIILSCTALFAQQKPEIQYFKAQHNDGIVYLEWALKTGSVCNGILITRSYDSLNFDIIGEIAGFCGSLSSPVTYRFQDAEPFKNRKIYYRLDLGGLTLSSVVTTYVPDAGFGQYSLFPNPVTHNSILQFFNPRNEGQTIRIMDMRGSEIRVHHTSDDHIGIGEQDLEPGLYFFIISKSDGTDAVISGSFYVSE